MLSLLRSSDGNETQEIFSERITIAYAHTKTIIYKYVQYTPLSIKIIFTGKTMTSSYLILNNDYRIHITC